MCPFVEKKRKKALCLVQHISTKKPPTLFFQPRPTLPFIPTPLLLIISTMYKPPIILTPPIIRDSFSF